jgi:hypothetical protein
VSDLCSSDVTPCIVPMFPLLQPINRGNLRSTGISRIFAKPLRSYRFPSLASASYGLPPVYRWPTIPGYYPLDPGCFTRDLWDIPMLAWLLRCRCLTRCCLRPREDGLALVFSAPAMLPAPIVRGSAPSKILFSRGYGADSGHTPFTSLDSHTSFHYRVYPYGRLTKPYP